MTTIAVELPDLIVAFSVIRDGEQVIYYNQNQEPAKVEQAIADLR